MLLTKENSMFYFNLLIYLFELCGKVLKHTALFDYLNTLLNQHISKKKSFSLSQMYNMIYYLHMVLGADTFLL